MATSSSSTDAATQSLLRALGIDLAALNPHTRAAIEALCEEVMALREDASEIRAALSDAELLADHDTLCPVFNRRAFEREVRREIALAARFGTHLSLIFIDLDHFKQVNDIYGHATGDDVLVRISEILLTSTRDTDIVGRLGGDEFGIVLAQAALADSQAKARELAGKIDALVVRREAATDLQPIQLGASCGVVEWQDGDNDLQLIARADRAMFAEKARRRGRNPQPPPRKGGAH